MNLVYVSNEKYAPHLATSICSVLENNKDESDIHFYVISTGLTSESVTKLKQMVKSYEPANTENSDIIRRLIVLNLNDLAQKMKVGPEHGFLSKFDVSILGRFFLGEMLPETIRKVIYLDADTVVVGPLRDFYKEIPDGDYICAGIIEPTIYAQTKDLLGLTDEDSYFNSGVLLIDMDKWHSSNIDYKLRTYYDGISKDSVFADQDAINGLLKGHIKNAPVRYNFFSNYYYRTRDSLVKLSPSYAVTSEEVFEKAKKSPVVIHFSGDERPWIRGNHNPYASEYHKYLALTPWKDTPQEEGKELFMQGYHAMNIATEIAPGVRDFISKKYGEKIHEDRSHNSKS